MGGACADGRFAGRGPGRGSRATAAPPATTDELLALFDKNVRAAREAISTAEDARLAEPWSMLMNGKPIMTLPRYGVLRTLTMNHLIHHRAQLGVYLRLNNVPVPATYGPSADEGGK
jgi:uncharacterized damage-inducible protein DinB